MKMMGVWASDLLNLTHFTLVPKKFKKHTFRQNQLAIKKASRLGSLFNILHQLRKEDRCQHRWYRKQEPLPALACRKGQQQIRHCLHLQFAMPAGW